MNLKQPIAGIIATIIIIAIALGFVSLFDFPTFAGPVAYFLLCLIPMQIIVAVVWGTNSPEFAAKRRQPLNGPVHRRDDDPCRQRYQSEQQAVERLITLAAGVVIA